MLDVFVREEIAKRGISIRAAAKQIGVSHGTLDRVVNGLPIDLETLIPISNWLGVAPSTLVNSFGASPDPTVAAIKLLIEKVPALEQIFVDAVEGIKSGEVDIATVRDILSYIAFRLTQSRVNAVTQED